MLTCDVFIALDLRALQLEFDQGLQAILAEELHRSFGPSIAEGAPPLSGARVFDSMLQNVHAALLVVIRDTLDATTNQDALPRLTAVASATTTPLVNTFLALGDSAASAPLIRAIPAFRIALAERGGALLQDLRRSYLSGERGAAPASRLLAYGTVPVYSFIRVVLGVKMHGWENLNLFDRAAMGVVDPLDLVSMDEGSKGRHSLGFDSREGTVGMNVSTIYESIRDGKMQRVISSHNSPESLGRRHQFYYSKL
jgi:phenylalanine ammonia-lyase